NDLSNYARAITEWRLVCARRPLLEPLGVGRDQFRHAPRVALLGGDAEVGEGRPAPVHVLRQPLKLRLVLLLGYLRPPRTRLGIPAVATLLEAVLAVEGRTLRPDAYAVPKRAVAQQRHGGSAGAVQ